MTPSQIAGTAPNTAWTTTGSIDDVVRKVRNTSRIVILTHSKPDGDAVGSTLALARTLDRRGKKAPIVFLSPWSDRFDSVVGSTRVIHEYPSCWERESELQSPDLVIIADTGSWNQVAAAREWLKPLTDRTIVLDHHSHGDADISSLRIINPGAAAACEIVADLCTRLLEVDSPRDLPSDVAQALYLGIATDTGWFRYSNLTSRTLQLASELIDAGARPYELYEQTELHETESRLRLIGHALSTMQLADDGKLAVIVVSKADLDRFGSSVEEASGFTDMPQTIATVRAVALLVELEANLTKLSLRSKAGTDSIDVNLVAQKFGGGGHRHAAGAKVKLSLNDARKQVISALSNAARA